MGKPKTVTTENGAVYQLSDPSALRLVYRIVGVALILMGAVLTLISPAGVAFAALGLALVFWLPKRSSQQRNFFASPVRHAPGIARLGIGIPKYTPGRRNLNALKKLFISLWPYCPITPKMVLRK